MSAIAWASATAGCPPAMDLVIFIDGSEAMAGKDIGGLDSRYVYTVRGLRNWLRTLNLTATGGRVAVAQLAGDAGLATAPPTHGQLTGNVSDLVAELLHHERNPSLHPCACTDLAPALQHAEQLLSDAQRLRVVLILAGSSIRGPDALNPALAALAAAGVLLYGVAVTEDAAELRALVSRPARYHYASLTAQHAAGGAVSLCDPAHPWGALLSGAQCVSLPNPVRCAARADCQWAYWEGHQGRCWPAWPEAGGCRAWKAEGDCVDYGRTFGRNCSWQPEALVRCADRTPAVCRAADAEPQCAAAGCSWASGPRSCAAAPAPPTVGPAAPAPGLALPQTCADGVAAAPGSEVPGPMLKPPFTVMARVRASRRRAAPAEGGAGAVYAVVVGWGGAGTTARELGIGAGGGVMYGEQGAALEVVGDSGNVTDGEWHHVAVSRGPPDEGGGGVVQLYRDGAPSAYARLRTDVSALIETNAETCRPPSCGARFAGDVDAVKMFDRALEPGEVLAQAQCCDCLGWSKCALPAPAAEPAPAGGFAPSGVPVWVVVLCSTAPLVLLAVVQVARRGVSWSPAVDFFASRRNGTRPGMEGAAKRHNGRAERRAERHATLMREISRELAKGRESGASTPSGECDYEMSDSRSLPTGASLPSFGGRGAPERHNVQFECRPAAFAGEPAMEL
eukprot:TRINITY_DN34984_c0_g1_i1.p1 TRINITY_DN34984_c0_g1~~TRINITY_DN34984_c0_g1_i1.p1  ORF type:complete len:720 (+),score=107.49 TRINITY_DN34984_c0_g1_i1:127-2160(+)